MYQRFSCLFGFMRRLYSDIILFMFCNQLMSTSSRKIGNKYRQFFSQNRFDRISRPFFPVKPQFWCGGCLMDFLV